MGQLACSSARSYRTLTQNVPIAGLLTGGAIPEIGSYLLERLYCNKDPFTQPFTPSDCDIRYTVTVTVRVNGDPFPSKNGTFSQTAVLWGAIGAPFVDRFTTGDDFNPDRARTKLSHYGNADLPRLEDPVTDEFNGLTAISKLTTYTILGMTAEPYPPGTGNTCALPPVTPYDPAQHTYDVPVPYTPPGGVAVTLPMIAVVGLFFVNAKGELNMPVTFNIKPDIDVNLSANFKVQATLNLTTGDTQIDWTTGTEPNTPVPVLPPTSRPPVTFPTNPAPPKPPSIPDIEPDLEADKQGKVLIGVIVTSVYSLNDSNITRIFQRDNPNVYVPYLGLVSFAIRTADGTVGWTNDIPVKNLRAFIPAPDVPGVFNVRGTPRPPTTWTLTPVYEQQLVLAGG